MPPCLMTHHLSRLVCLRLESFGKRIKQDYKKIALMLASGGKKTFCFFLIAAPNRLPKISLCPWLIPFSFFLYPNFVNVSSFLARFHVWSGFLSVIDVLQLMSPPMGPFSSSFRSEKTKTFAAKSTYMFTVYTFLFCSLWYKQIEACSLVHTGVHSTLPESDMYVLQQITVWYDNPDFSCQQYTEGKHTTTTERYVTDFLNN